MSVQNDISRALQQYTTEIENELKRAQNVSSKEAIKELKMKSQNRTGKYAKGWARKKTDTGYIIYNKDRGQITHLLEHGHQLRGGGRSKSFPHIRKVEEKTIEKYVNMVEDAIR